MVFVLEGTSVALALNAADQIQRTLALPAKALSYLRFDTAEDRSAVLMCARVMFTLYGNVFRELDDLPRAAGEPLRKTA